MSRGKVLVGLNSFKDPEELLRLALVAGGVSEESVGFTVGCSETAP